MEGGEREVEEALFIKGSSASINSPPLKGSTTDALLLQKSIATAILGWKKKSYLFLNKIKEHRLRFYRKILTIKKVIFL